MHGDELTYMTEAYTPNWMSTLGANIDSVEKLVCEKVGCKYAVALASGTAALHLAIKLAGVGQRTGSFGTYNCVSSNGNKIITDSAGGMLLTDREQDVVIEIIKGYFE